VPLSFTYRTFTTNRFPTAPPGLIALAVRFFLPRTLRWLCSTLSLIDAMGLYGVQGQLFGEPAPWR
jgi:hypothetical protein